MDQTYQDEISLRDLIIMIWNGRKWIAVITGACVLISLIVTYGVMDPTYEAKTVVMARDFAEQPPAEKMIMLEESLANSRLDRQALNDLLDHFASSPQLSMEALTYQAGSEMVLKRAAEKLHLDEKKYSIGYLKSLVKVEHVKDTNLIELKVRHTDPRFAADLANAVGEAFKLAVQQKNQEYLEKGIRYVQEQLRATEAKLKKSEKELAAFHQQSPSVMELQKEVDAKLDLLTKLKVEYGGKSNARADVRALQEDVKRLQAQLALKNAELERLKTQVENAQQLYAFFLQKQEELLMAKNLEKGSTVLTVVNPAYPPEEPVSPKPLLNFALSMVLGLMIGVMAVFLRAALNPGEAKDKLSVTA